MRMVRNYKRKSNRQQWGKNQMIEAINAIANGEISLNQAATKYSIPKSTLVRYYHKSKVEDINFDDCKLGSYKTTFTEEQETQLKQYIRDVNLSLCELSPLELRRIAFQYAEMNGIPHSFNRKAQLAGYDWYKNFMKRNEIQEKSIKSENEPSLLLSCGLNVTYSIEKYFDLLTELQQFYKFPPNRIYNVHDRGFISIPNLTSKMFSTTDKAMATVEFLTVISCCSATGTFIPPLMVYPTKEEDPDFAKDCPPGTKIVCHSSGTIQTNTFYPTWFYHFVNHVQPHKGDPILILLDGRGIYMKNMRFIEKAKELDIHILSIPVNLSDKLYPMEVKFMTDLKSYYGEEQSKWYEENRGQVIDLKSVGKIFGSAYAKAAVPDGMINAFKGCGIYPLNRYVLADEHNAPLATPFITESSNNISTSAENTSEESSSSMQIPNYGISIKGPGDINNSLNNTEDLNYFLFENLMEGQEDSCPEMSIEKEEETIYEEDSTRTYPEDEAGSFEKIYQKDSFEYCD